MRQQNDTVSNLRGGAMGPDPVSDLEVFAMVSKISMLARVDLKDDLMLKTWRGAVLPTLQRAARLVLEFKAAQDF